MDVIEQILRIVAPHHCVGCGSEGAVLCRTCAASLPVVPPRCYRCGRATDDYRVCTTCRPRSALSQVHATTFYDDLAKQLVHQLKFGRAKAAAQDVAGVMATRLDLSTEYIITHVPTAPSRVRQRGYDQAELIARALARRLDWPHRTLLARTNAARQLGQTRSVRLQQLHQAFRVLSPETVGRQPILLVDDVLTTGSTCEAAAAALRAAGAAHVSAAIFAAA